MKITRLHLFHVKPRWLFLKMSTDDGIVGWGEPIVEGRVRTVETAVRELESYLIGRIHDRSSIIIKRCRATRSIEAVRS